MKSNAYLLVVTSLHLLVILIPDGIVLITANVFNRIATFNICTQIDPTCNTDIRTVAEIVDATPDGTILVYTNGEQENIGFIDISDPTTPIGTGIVNFDGEPSSIAVTKDGMYAIAAVNTSPDFINPSGNLLIIDIQERTVISNLELPGQPDSVTISPDNTYIAVVIENERDEDLNDDGDTMPQLPPGLLLIVNKTLTTDPNSWTMTNVTLTNLDGIEFAPEDPEPEYVDINENNIAVITLQENNGIVLVDLVSATVIQSYSAGTVDLVGIDITDDGIIMQIDNLLQVPREPDAVTYIGNNYFATADEGDLSGGSRGFTIFNVNNGTVVYSSGSELDLLAASIGHYPEHRSDNKGNEPEGCGYDVYGDDNMLFILSERSSVIYVYQIDNPNDISLSSITLKQILPSGIGPEGVKTIPSRDLLIVAAEIDDRDIGFRSSIGIYQYQNTTEIMYPTMKSSNRQDGTPIPFSALSGLACQDAPTVDISRCIDGYTTLFSIEDSSFEKSRIFEIDTSTFPYTLTTEIRIMDPNGVLTAVDPDHVNDDDDKTVNLDLEGIAVSNSGGFWVVSEGSGKASDDVETNNLLIKVSELGIIEDVVSLPAEVNDIQDDDGFHGVAEDGDYVVVAFQRSWQEDTNHPRIGIYNTSNASWKFVFYPLDTPTSQNGGWVGLSDIAPVGEGIFYVLERDNQGGPDASIKKIYSIDLGLHFSIEDGAIINKTEVVDLMPYLRQGNGNIYEKVEGLCVSRGGDMWIINDNDGVDDNSGESMLLKIDAPADVVTGPTIEPNSPTIAPAATVETNGPSNSTPPETDINSTAARRKALLFCFSTALSFVVLVA